MKFLGFAINSIEMTSLPEDKVSNIKKCRHALNQHWRQLANLIGLLSACIPAILEAPLHYRALQRLRYQAVGLKGYNFNRPIVISQEAQQDLWWWVHNLSTSRPILRPAFLLTLKTDAFILGCEAYIHEDRRAMVSQWPEKSYQLAEASDHINWLELQGAFLALQSFVAEKEFMLYWWWTVK